MQKFFGDDQIITIANSTIVNMFKILLNCIMFQGWVMLVSPTEG